MRVLASVPRRDDQPPWSSLPPPPPGFPVVIDDEVEVGVIELRKGDEVVERFFLPELRA